MALQPCRWFSQLGAVTSRVTMTTNASRMGYNHDGQSSEQCVVMVNFTSLHKCTGTAGSFSFKAFPAPSQEPSCLSEDGQPDGGSLHQPSERDHQLVCWMDVLMGILVDGRIDYLSSFHIMFLWYDHSDAHCKQCLVIHKWTDQTNQVVWQCVVTHMNLMELN